MAKFTSEEKLRATLRYLNGKESSYEIARSMRNDFEMGKTI